MVPVVLWASAVLWPAFALAAHTAGSHDGAGATRQLLKASDHKYQIHDPIKL